MDDLREVLGDAATPHGIDLDRLHAKTIQVDLDILMNDRAK